MIIAYNVLLLYLYLPVLARTPRASPHTSIGAQMYYDSPVSLGITEPELFSSSHQSHTFSSRGARVVLVVRARSGPRADKLQAPKGHVHIHGAVGRYVWPGVEQSVVLGGGKSWERGRGEDVAVRKVSRRVVEGFGRQTAGEA